ncbi:MAG: hypothetical protein ABEH64_02085 [Salinirussus sp.]
MANEKEVVAVKADELSDDTAQTEGLPRLDGISSDTADADLDGAADRTTRHGLWPTPPW